MDQRPKCKAGHYKTLRGKRAEQTLTKITAKSNENKTKYKQMGPN